MEAQERRGFQDDRETDQPARTHEQRTDAGNHAIAVGLATIPEKIRGFGHVKQRHLAAAKADEAALFEQLQSGSPPLLKAAE